MSKANREERKKKEDYIPFGKKISNFVFIIKSSFDVLPGFTMSAFFLSAFRGIASPIYNIFFLKWLVDYVDQGKDFSEIIMMVIFVAVIFLIDIVLNRLFWNYLWPRAGVKFNLKLHKKLFKKATTIELSCYDNSKFYTDFIWSMNNSTGLILDCTYKIMSCIEIVITMFVTGAFIFNTEIYMFGFVIVSISISTLLVFVRNKINYKYSLDLNKVMVKRDYVQRVFSIPDYAKEMKITRITDLLLKNYDKAISDMRKCVDKHGPKMAAVSSAEGIASDVIFNCGTLIYLSIRTLVFKAITPGNFIGLYNAISEFQYRITRLMQIIPELDLKSMEVNNFRKFMEYEPRMKDKENAVSLKKEIAPIEIKNLYYTYDGAEKPVLKNINMTIKAGEKIAIVGYNGAGKSTLIKLIMRLYDPDSGSVSYNGTDVKNYKMKDYRNIFGVAFQDFQIYATSVKNNVIMGIANEDDELKVENSLKKSGVFDKIQTLEKGMDTELTREFYDDGVNLSGGEQQKIAISRVFVNDNPFVILDEPSAALDPIAEYEFNRTTLDACKEKSVIFISHRLSTTKVADKIYMLENGEIIEEGSHNDLMKLNGKYAEMFNKQAENYIDKSANV